MIRTGFPDKTGHRRRRPCERVQQADDDRHVSTADGRDHDPEDQAGQHDDARSASATRCTSVRTPAHPGSGNGPSRATSAMAIVTITVT